MNENAHAKQMQDHADAVQRAYAKSLTAAPRPSRPQTLSDQTDDAVARTRRMIALADQTLARTRQPGPPPAPPAPPPSIAVLTAQFMKEGMVLEDAIPRAYETVRMADYQPSNIALPPMADLSGAKPRVAVHGGKIDVELSPVKRDTRAAEIAAELFGTASGVSVVRIGDTLVAKIPLLGGQLNPKSLDQLSAAFSKAGF